jgi:hypothetical protein
MMRIVHNLDSTDVVVSAYLPDGKAVLLRSVVVWSRNAVDIDWDGPGTVHVRSPKGVHLTKLHGKDPVIDLLPEPIPDADEPFRMEDFPNYREPSPRMAPARTMTSVFKTETSETQRTVHADGSATRWKRDRPAIGDSWGRWHLVSDEPPAPEKAACGDVTVLVLTHAQRDLILSALWKAARTADRLSVEAMRELARDIAGRP